MVKTIGMIDAIGVIGTGQFGQFLIERIRAYYPLITIKTWDLHKKSRHSVEEVATCPAVVFAVPPKTYASSMRHVIPLMRADGIIVDICTVKMHTVKLLHELAHGRPYIATHPMFGPQSYTDEGNALGGLEVAICEHTLTTQLYDGLLTVLEGLGLKIVQISPEEHDRNAAEEQLLTQHIGTIVREAGFARAVGGAHTRSSMHFYTAMEIVKDDGPLFDDVSELNPFWPEIEARFELAVAKRRLAMVMRKNGQH